jgi:hypothetical protein
MMFNTSFSYNGQGSRNSQVPLEKATRRPRKVDSTLAYTHTPKSMMPDSMTMKEIWGIYQGIGRHLETFVAPTKFWELTLSLPNLL